MKRLAPLALALVVAGCAQGGGAFNITCAAQTAGDASAMSCATITINGNTPTATGTVPITIPVGPGAGLGTGGGGLPTIPGFPLAVNGAMVMAPVGAPVAVAPRLSPRRLAPRPAPATPYLSMGPPKQSSLETMPWPEFWRATTTHIRALDDKLIKGL